jgi:molybdopterin-guanine dinucleotide biosynthesis protein A
MQDISALILVGGQSRRMGCDKALLEVEGRSLLRRVYDVAQACASQVFVITPYGDRYRSLLPADCRWIAEVPPALGEPAPGPLMGFAQAWPHISTPWVLLLACDLPYLEVEVLQQWCAMALKTTPPPLALVSFQNQRWEPLCALYHQSCRPSLADYINQGGRSFQRWLNHQPVQLLTVVNPSMLQNCNTPKDFDFLPPAK